MSEFVDILLVVAVFLTIKSFSQKGSPKPFLHHFIELGGIVLMIYAFKLIIGVFKQP